MFAHTMRDCGIGISIPDCQDALARHRSLHLLIKLLAFNRRTHTRPYIRFSRFVRIAFRSCAPRANGANVAVRCSNLLIPSFSRVWAFPPIGKASSSGSSASAPVALRRINAGKREWRSGILSASPLRFAHSRVTQRTQQAERRLRRRERSDRCSRIDFRPLLACRASDLRSLRWCVEIPIPSFPHFPIPSFPHSLISPFPHFLIFSFPYSHIPTLHSSRVRS